VFSEVNRKEHVPERFFQVAGGFVQDGGADGVKEGGVWVPSVWMNGSLGNSSNEANTAVALLQLSYERIFRARQLNAGQWPDELMKAVKLGRKAGTERGFRRPLWSGHGLPSPNWKCSVLRFS
jgi:hypothetical protein